MKVFLNCSILRKKQEIATRNSNEGKTARKAQRLWTPMFLKSVTFTKWELHAPERGSILRSSKPSVPSLRSRRLGFECVRIYALKYEVEVAARGRNG